MERPSIGAVPRYLRAAGAAPEHPAAARQRRRGEDAGAGALPVRQLQVTVKIDRGNITVFTIVRDYILANKHRFQSQVEPATGELLRAGVQDHGDQGGGELSTRCLLQWCLGISKVT